MTVLRVRRRVVVAAAATAIAGGALPASPAQAEVRLASPTSAEVSGACTALPCRLDRALAVAQPGDEVALADGAYAVPVPVRATTAVTIRPAVAGARPRLVGAVGADAPTLELAAGGSVRGLRIEATDGVALQLAHGARGIGLVVRAEGRSKQLDAVRLLSAPGTTALVSSSVDAPNGATAVSATDGPVPGTAAVVNVTARVTGRGTRGVTTELRRTNLVVRNTIVRAEGRDLDAGGDALPIDVAHSNFGRSDSGTLSGPGNQIDVPVAFVDESRGDLRVRAGARTIDAGVRHPLAQDTADPDGRPRALGAGPDMGAYEADAGSRPSSPGSPGPARPGRGPDPAAGGGSGSGSAGERPVPALGPAGPPVLAERVRVEATSGAPLVRLPGADRSIALADAATVPVGSTIDATRGHVELTSVRDRSGRVQTGEFWGGRFVVRQTAGRMPYTDLVLRASFAGCPAARSASRGAPLASAARRRRGRRSVVRSLWGRDRSGRFRTHGRDSVATVRGTTWLVQDRCDGTLTRVLEGSVAVRDPRRGRTVLVRAGQRHFVRHASR